MSEPVLNPLEGDIEKAACEFARRRGVIVKKLVIASEASWPDRTFLFRDHTMFIEFKRKGETPTPLQSYTIDSLRSEGFVVHVCDDLKAAKTIIDEWTKEVSNVNYKLAGLR